jgi:hypothetical protein
VAVRIEKKVIALERHLHKFYSYDLKSINSMLKTRVKPSMPFQCESRDQVVTMVEKNAPLHNEKYLLDIL